MFPSKRKRPMHGSLSAVGSRRRARRVAFAALPILLLTLAGVCDPIWIAQVTVVVPGAVQEHVRADLPLTLYFKADVGRHRESGEVLAVVCAPGDELRASAKHVGIGGVYPTKLIAWLGDPDGHSGARCGLVPDEERLGYEPVGPVPTGAPQAEAWVFTDVDALSGRVERVELVLATP
jgi:hypothetical protein